ncbi:hypothetical protein ACFLTX_03225 [Chloroflexota bacterium]
MLWIVIIVALVIGIVAGLISKNPRKGLGVGFTILVAGTILSILIVYSGIMGG